MPAALEDAVGQSVYLDYDQCVKFISSDGSGYYAQSGIQLVIAASTLLNSKDYDELHQNLLKPLGSAAIVCDPAPDAGPGWFTITRVIPSR